MKERACVSKNKKNECLVDLSLTITQGKFFALLHGLEQRAQEGSPVASDLLYMLKVTATDNKVPVE